MKMQRIRDLREDNDLKQIDIADYLHISLASEHIHIMRQTAGACRLKC